jgi:hypothetical protein
MALNSRCKKGAKQFDLLVRYSLAKNNTVDVSFAVMDTLFEIETETQRMNVICAIAKRYKATPNINFCYNMVTFYKEVKL